MYTGALASVNLNDVSVGSSQVTNNRAGMEGGGFFVGSSSVLRLFWSSLWQGNVCNPANLGTFPSSQPFLSDFPTDTSSQYIFSTLPINTSSHMHLLTHPLKQTATLSHPPSLSHSPPLPPSLLLVNRLSRWGHLCK